MDLDVRRRPSLVVTWALAGVVPVLAGACSWLLSEETISGRTCASGGGGRVGLAAYAVLVFAAPAITGWRVRRATDGRSMFPVLIGLFCH
jgi:hypothetical protein